MQLPIGSGNELVGIVDLLAMKAFFFEGEKGETVVEKEIPADMAEKVEEWRRQLVEKAAELDDELMERYLEDEASITTEQIKAALRKGTIERACNPVFTGSALKNIGVQRLIDGVVDYLPNPTQVPPVTGLNPKNEEEKIERPHDPKAPFSALVFKVVNDTHGDLTYARVYSGTLPKGSRVLNPVNGKKENVSRIFEMHANSREALDQVEAGNIVALVGVKDSITGDTLCDATNPIVLERMTFPEPVISMSIEPKTADDKKKLTDALVTIKREDPSFRSEYNEETGQTIIAGMGELHLEIITTRIQRDMKVNVEVGKPRVSYREAIQGTAEKVEGKFKKQTGGSGQFGHCVINLKPMTAEEAEAAEL
ncbi:MAG: EF-Tu/IF-2/RF-3 family GTPase, partial [Planctomycetota bacterium]